MEGAEPLRPSRSYGTNLVLIGSNHRRRVGLYEMRELKGPHLSPEKGSLSRLLFRASETGRTA